MAHFSNDAVQTCIVSALSVLDFNHLLLFIACASPLVVLARAWRRPRLKRPWQFAALAVLAITALAFFLVPGRAGFVGGSAWLLFLLLPAIGLRQAAELASKQRFASARRLLGFLRFLHPSASVRHEKDLMTALEFAQHGENGAAEEILGKVVIAGTPFAKQASAQLLRLRRDWEGLVRFYRQSMPGVGLGDSPILLPLYLRALGEIGARDEMVLQFAGRAPALLASPNHQQIFATSYMLVLAFSGRTSALLSSLENGLRRLPEHAKEFWIATSEAAAGEIGASRARLELLQRTTSDALIRQDCHDRLRRVPELEASLSPHSVRTITRFERLGERADDSLLAPRSGQLTPVVFTIIALNLAMFLIEIVLGGATNDMTLHRLGALEPSAVISLGQYWRLFAALFLHYGTLHLLVNLYALYVLGPPLEAALGAPRFALCYLLAGFGSSVGVVLLWRFGLTQADFLVGASGAVMGIVGAWAGLLSRNRHMPLAGRRLASIGIIILIQTTFDFLTPQISMAAHLSGLVTGVFVGFLLAPNREL